MKSALRIIAIPALLMLNSCFSVCWLSLNLSDTYLHRDTTVVISRKSKQTTSYTYQGKEWHPITLAYATDKGKGIIRRGDNCGYCPEDTSRRYAVHEGSERNYLYSFPTWETPDAPHQLIPEKDFNYAAARSTTDSHKHAATSPDFRHTLAYPYAEFPHAVADMPLPEPPAPPGIWERVLAEPLCMIDLAGSLIMNVSNVVVTPVVRITTGITSLFSSEDE